MLMTGPAHSCKGSLFHSQACRMPHSISSMILLAAEGQREQHNSHLCRRKRLLLEISLVHQLRICQS